MISTLATVRPVLRHLAPLLGIAMFLGSCRIPEELPHTTTNPQFQSLFDGSTLDGWRGDPTIWSIRDRAITGGSYEELTNNTFLISDSSFGDFELHYRYRLDGNGNSGMQFRSYVADEARFVVKGYQANVVPVDQAERFGMLWEEGGRGELALLGHDIIIGRKDGEVTKTVLASTNPRELLYRITRPYPEWNDVVVIAFGNRLVHALNGYLVFNATDSDPAARNDGIIAIQVHSGPPMHVQFKDIEVAPLTAMPSISDRFITNPGDPTPANPGPRVNR